MRKHLAMHGVQVELDTELVDLQQGEDGVTAILVKRKGQEEVKETVFADYLIGAEGAKSAHTTTLAKHALTLSEQVSCGRS